MIVGSFGDKLIFEVSANRVFTPHKVSREIKAKYEEHEVMGAKPRLEFIAPELMTLTLPIVLSASQGIRPVRQLVRLECCVIYGWVELLILGGMRHGYHVITECSEQWRHTLPDGEITGVEATLTFKEYVK